MDFTQFPRPTKTYHTTSYPAISPSRPELSLSGKTALITGGATGIGLEISRGLAMAGVSKIVMVARTQGPMDEAKSAIEKAYPGTEVRPYAASVSDHEHMRKIVKEVEFVDILILNAAHVHPPMPVSTVSAEEVEMTFAVNVLGPLHLISAVMALPPRTEGIERTIIFTSAAGIQFVYPGLVAYNASKAASTYIMTAIAAEQSSGWRTFSFHPALAYTPLTSRVMGLKPDSLNFDSAELPGHFAVWLCSPEADFLSGRYVWAHWDVEELMAKKNDILQDPFQLKLGIVQDKVVE